MNANPFGCLLIAHSFFTSLSRCIHLFILSPFFVLSRLFCFANTYQQIKDGPEVPISLRAVKMLARYLSSPADKEIAIQSLGEWLTAGQSVWARACLIFFFFFSFS
jgi:hypothetical protein